MASRFPFRVCRNVTAMKVAVRTPGTDVKSFESTANIAAGPLARAALRSRATVGSIALIRGTASSCRPTIRSPYRCRYWYRDAACGNGLVQRLLVAKSRRDASVGLVLSGFLVLAQFALFLFLGTLFWAYYQGRPFARGDEVLPTFVSTHLPGGLVGLILAAIVAAALSPSLNSMASTTVRDFYVPYVRPGASDDA